MHKEITEKIRFPKGKYFIGDLALAIKDEHWNKFVDKMENSTRLRNGVGKCKYNKMYFWWHGTFWGKGDLTDDESNLYGNITDSMGMCPIEMFEGGTYKALGDFRIKEFDEDFDVWYNNGVFEFGDVIINSIR